MVATSLCDGLGRCPPPHRIFNQVRYRVHATLRFRAYVEQFLVPTLKPSDVVILDNLGSHKGKAVRKAIRDVGARLVFLPKYSPDLNPIEQVFAKFKTLLELEARPALAAKFYADVTFGRWRGRSRFVSMWLATAKRISSRCGATTI